MTHTKNRIASFPALLGLASASALLLVSPRAEAVDVMAWSDFQQFVEAGSGKGILNWNYLEPSDEYPQSAQLSEDLEKALLGAAAGVIESGDPVNGRGDFVLTEQDLVVPGFGMPLVVGRTYRSKSPMVGALGAGWDLSLQQRLVEEENCAVETVSLSTGTNSAVKFTAVGTVGNATTFVPSEQGTPLALTRYGDFLWQMEDADGIKRDFDSNGNLKRIWDRQGHEIRLTWSHRTFPSMEYKECDTEDVGGVVRYTHCLTKRLDTPVWRVWSVTDTRGSTFYLRYDWTNRFLRCVTQDANENAGCANALVTYHYSDETFPVDKPTYLTGVKNRLGNGMSYEYDLTPRREVDAYLATDAVDAACDAMCGTSDEQCMPGCNVLEAIEEGSPGFHIKNPGQHALIRQRTDYCDQDEPTACHQACVSKTTNPGGTQFGRLEDLVGNITSVRDPDGRLVVANEYGTDVMSPSFDSVVRQQVGEDEASIITWDWHDLAAEHRGHLAGEQDPDFDYARVTTARGYVGYELCACAAWDNDGRCTSQVPSATAYPIVSSTGQVSHAAVGGQVHPYDGPAFAAVIADYRGSVRTQYFSDAWMLLREVEHHEHDGEGRAQRDYWWTGLHLSGTRGATGQVTCEEVDTLGRMLQTTAYPRSGTAEVPDVTQQYYGSDGLPWVTIAHVTTAPARTVMKYTTDGLVSWVEQDAAFVNGALQKEITYYSYPSSVTARRDGTTFQVAPWAPTQVTSPSGTVRYSYCGGAFGTVSATCSPLPSAVQTNPEGVGTTTYALHDFYGRVLQSGLPDANVAYAYDAAGRLQTSRVVVAGLTPETTTWTYVGKTTRATTVTSSRAEVEQGYDVSGEVIWMTARALDQGVATRTTCMRRDPLDGRVLMQVLPEGELERYTYDDEGRLTAVDRGYPTPSLMVQPWALRCQANLAGNPDPNKYQHLGEYERLVDRQYTAAGLVVAEIAAGAYSQVTRRDGFDEVLEVVDAAGNRWRSGYSIPTRTSWVATLGPGTSGYGRPDPSLSDPALSGFAETRSDLLGREIRQEVWRFAYGAPVGPELGIMTTTERTCPNRNPWGGTNEPHCSVSVTAAAGTPEQRTTRMVYDGAGRVIETHLPGMTTPMTTSWPDGFHAIHTSPSPRPGTPPIVTHEYLDVRYLTRHTMDDTGNSLGEVTRDVAGRVVSAAGPGGQQSWIVYDAFGQVTETRAKINATTNKVERQGFDRMGRVVTVTDGRDNATRFRYDAQGRKYNTIDPDGHAHQVMAFAPGTSRPLQAQALPSGTVTEMRYDPIGRLLRMAMANGQGMPVGTVRKTFEYDLYGMSLATIESTMGTTSYVNTTTLEHDSLGFTLSEYNDALGDFLRVTEVPSRLGGIVETSVGGTVIERELGPLGLTNLSVNGHQVAELSYAVPGIVYHTAFGPTPTRDVPQIVENRRFDGLGRSQALEVSLSGASGLQPVTSLRYVYGVDGVPRARVTQHAEAAPTTTYFQTDLLGRVIGEERRTGATTLTQNATNGSVAHGFACASNASPLYACNANAQMSPHGRAYLLDATDNLRVITYADRVLAYDFGLANEVEESREFDGTSWNTLDAVVYDGTGAVVRSPLGDRQYDGQGTMLTSGDTEYRMDALDRRIQELRDGKVTHLVWSGATLLAIAEASTSEPPRGLGDVSAMSVNVGYGLDVQLGDYDPIADRVEYLHQGPDLSVLARTTSDGLIEGYVYTAFGEVTVLEHRGEPVTAEPRGRRLFQGQLYDPETATYSMRAREYDPKTGRFLSRDPMGTAGGLNLYSFVGAQPLTQTDPLGLAGCPMEISTDFLGAGASGAANAVENLAGEPTYVVFDDGDVVEGNRPAPGLTPPDCDDCGTDPLPPSPPPTGDVPPIDLSDAVTRFYYEWFVAPNADPNGFLAYLAQYPVPLASAYAGAMHEASLAAMEQKQRGMTADYWKHGVEAMKASLGLAVEIAESIILPAAVPATSAANRALRGAKAVGATSAVNRGLRAANTIGTRTLRGQAHAAGNCTLAASEAARAYGLSPDRTVEGVEAGIVAVHRLYPKYLRNDWHYALRLPDGRFVDMSLIKNIEGWKQAKLPAGIREHLMSVDTFTPAEYEGLLKVFLE